MIDDLLKFLGLTKENMTNNDDEGLDLDDVFKNEYESVKVKVLVAGDLGNNVLEAHEENKKDNVSFVNIDIAEIKEEMLKEAELTKNYQN